MPQIINTRAYLKGVTVAPNTGTPAALCTATALGTVKPTPVVIGFLSPNVCSKR